MTDEESDTLIRKLAGFQTVIPQFDNLSAITPKYFIEHLENITNIAKCTKEEKLLILRSRIRGPALTSLISTPDLYKERDYDEFKKKFLSYFDTQYSLGARQKQFSNCKMLPNEQVKTYAAKVALATENFFNAPDLTNDAIKTIFENTKLGKFIDGLLPNYKQSVILKDPKTFESAVEFAQMLQANEIISDSQSLESVNNVTKVTDKNEIKDILEAHASNTMEMINSLTKEVEQLKLQTRHDLPRAHNNYSFRPPYRRGANNSRFSRNRYYTQRNVPNCDICNKSHFTSECYNNPANRSNFRGRFNRFTRSGRASYTIRNMNKDNRSQTSRDFQQDRTVSKNV